MLASHAMANVNAYSTNMMSFESARAPGGWSARLPAPSPFSQMRRNVVVCALLVLALPATGFSGRLGAGDDLAATRWTVPAKSRIADFGTATPSTPARRLADWVAATDDSRGAQFVIIDKRSAHLYVFDAQARLLAASPVLLGAAVGDKDVPGIGERPIALIRPEERTTPAGRFVAERGRNARGEDVVWVDYDAAISMHRVVTSNASERRLERLLTPSARDNRISYGCINVPVSFYEEFVRPAFARHPGIVYVMPEVTSIHQVFGVPDGAEVRQANAGRVVRVKDR